MWPDILEAVKNRRRFTWILLSQNAQVTGFDGATLQLGFLNAGARDTFSSSGAYGCVIGRGVRVRGRPTAGAAYGRAVGQGIPARGCGPGHPGAWVWAGRRVPPTRW
ncbi:hypothetical protein [Streptomyces sp. gb1(2016)]|uniref:Uncharacterized protein n=1 Tax=Streptomyces sp. gb1(2016) TaxID=1828321 RepID=A0A652KIJ7_9ACTN|nr:hypothetical protein [Streptomyces sp. gb1(2016)]TXS23364.1 hypothetical protein EAO74_22320 [Streptomyces sp. gb1(2016)]